MENTTVQTHLYYENKWLKIKEIGLDEESNLIICKVINEDFINPTESWKREKYLKNSLDHIALLEESLNTKVSRNEKAYVLPKGNSLLNLIKYSNIEMSERLRIATDILNITLELHSKGYLLCDLNPNLFWCDLIDEQTYLIDTIMTVATKNITEFYNTVIGIEPDMYSMSPEQILNSASNLDFRSNYYSLGILFYALFTGQFPINSSDRISVIHKHLSQMPIGPKHINEELNAGLSNFIIKLLAKDPIERYQSSIGLMHDFELCKALQQKGDSSVSIELGAKDFPIKFNVPNSVFFRKEEHETLMELSKKSDSGKKAMAIVKGEEGSGSSYLLRDFFGDINYDRFYIGSGKYSLESSIPFKGLKDVTSEIFHQVLMEDPSLIRDLKASMQKSISSLSGVLINFDRDFEYLFDTYEESDELVGNAAINRFIYAYTEFLRLLELQGKSIILSLERFELVDIGTSRLITQILKSSFLRRILIVISVNTDTNSHNNNCKEFMTGVDNGFNSQESLITEVLQLNNYQPERVHEILEYLKIEPGKPFGDILYQKSKGNLSIIKQFFEELISQDQIKANVESKIWQVDLQAAQNINVSDNLHEFLKNRIEQLNKEELFVLKAATAIGQTIEVKTLHNLLSFDKERTDSIINDLRNKGFLTPLEYSNARLSLLKFSHPGFHSELQNAMEKSELENFKLQLIKILFANLDENQIESRVYELVTHLMPLSPERCAAYADYLETAAHKAKRETAFESASQYYLKLIEIDDSKPNIDQKAKFEHTFQAALCALYAINYKLYQDLLKRLEAIIATKHQESRIFILKAIDSIQRGNNQETLINLEQGLKDMGVNFSLNITKFQIIKMFIFNLWKSRNINETNILELPFNTDEKQSIYQRLINISAPAVYFLKPELTARLTYIGIKDTFSKGVIRETPYNLIALAFQVNNFSNKIATAHRLCKAGFSLMKEKIKDKEESIPLNFLYSSFIQHTIDPLANCITSLDEFYKKGRELGNISIAHYCLGMNRWYLLFDGTPLDKLFELLNASHKLCVDDNQALIDVFHRLIKSLILELKRGKFSHVALEDESLPINKDDFKNEKITKNRILFANIILIKLIIDAGNNQFKGNEQLIKQILNTVNEGGHGTFNSVYHIFYACYHIFKGKLVITGVSKKQLDKFIKIIEVRSQYAPFNYEVKWLLLKALKAESKEEVAEANTYYAEAYIKSIEYGNIWDKALSCELFGVYLVRTGLKKAGRNKIAEAIFFYNQWGAESIVNRLKNEYPELLDEALNYSDNEAPNNKVNPSETKRIDNVLKWSTSLYGQDNLSIQVSALLDKLIEVASAEKGVFIIKNDEDFKIYAQKEDGNTVIKNRSADISTLPMSLLRFVSRRKNYLVIGDASSSPQYRSDPYIKKRGIKSILCIPFVRGNQVKSLIYLENNKFENVFNNSNLSLINWIYSQIAVSVDNFILTDLLEEKLEQRSLQIKAERDKANDLITNILPKKIAEELKSFGRVKAQKYENVSVLFTDFKDFTLFSEKLNADQIISELDECFRTFDNIVEKFGLEKIKTIGDAYMCAGGIPEPLNEHEYKIVQAGLEMLEYMEASNVKRVQKGIAPLGLRVGIHVGPLIAGVVGSKKYAYDIWGPTVNIASRMESSGKPGMLNVSGSVHLKVKDKFKCSYRGKISAKNIGDVDMYFVNKAE
jgi:histidine kinase